jgi:uncharacterized protein YidB (DUF937 family)
VSPDEEEVANIAQQLGLPEDQAADCWPKRFRQVVDQATPEGEVPEDEQV